jgi:hypothetical protein
MNDDVKRFMSYVEVLQGGCWYWTGARSRGKGNKKWYGSFHYNGKTIRAHRFSAIYIGGQRELEKGEHRDHVCRFSMCVNPEHTEIVTHEENQKRKVDARSRNAGQGPSAARPVEVRLEGGSAQHRSQDSAAEVENVPDV